MIFIFLLFLSEKIEGISMTESQQESYSHWLDHGNRGNVKRQDIVYAEAYGTIETEIPYQPNQYTHYHIFSPEARQITLYIAYE